MTNCPFCGKLTDPNLPNCVHCGGILQKGGPGQRAKGASGGSQTCPNCGALVQDGDIICVACGTNLLTGQKVTQQRPAARRGGSAVTPAKVGVIVLIVAAVALLILGLYWLTRDPVKQAQGMARNGRISEATQILETHVKTRPDDTRAQFLLGVLRTRTQQFEQAARAFETVSQREPLNRDAHLLAALNYASLKSPYTREQEIASLKRLVEEYANDDEGWYLLGLAEGARGDFDAQAAALTKAYGRTGGADAGRALALALAMQGEVSKARAQLQTATAGGGDSEDARAASAALDQLAGQGDAAAAKLAALAARSDQVDVSALTQLAVLYIEQGRYDDASDLLNKVLLRDQTNTAVRFFKAVTQEARGLNEDALVTFEALAQGTDSYAAKAATEAARIHLSRQDYERALDAAGRALSKGQDSPALSTLRGRALLGLGKMDEAQSAFRRAIQIDPDYAPAHLENGLLYIKRGAIGEGIRELETYLKLVDRRLPDSRVDQVEAVIAQLRQASGLSRS